MKKTSLIIGSALLLATAAIGAAVASSDNHFLRHHRHESADARRGEDRPARFADRAGRHGEGRRHHDGDHHGKRRERPSQAGPPAVPDAPAPDNGLFSKGARPTVEVQ